MLISDLAKRIINRRIKELYNNEIDEKQKPRLEEDEVVQMINRLYQQEEGILRKKIFEEAQIKVIPYPGDEIVYTNLDDIFEDQKYCKNRVKIEIMIYQRRVKATHNNPKYA